MKKKLIILTLCFTIIISSINFKKVDAFDFVISPTIAAVVVTLGVGAGIVLNSDGDISSLANEFYNYHKSNWEVVETAFKSTVSFESNRITRLSNSEGSFLDYCKDFFTNTYNVADIDSNFSSTGGLPSSPERLWRVIPSFEGSGTIEFSDIKVSYSTRFASTNLNYIDLTIEYLTSTGFVSKTTYTTFKNIYDLVGFYYVSNVSGVSPSSLWMEFVSSDTGTKESKSITLSSSWIHNSAIALPGSNAFDWEKNIESNEDETGLGAYVPGNLGDLVGVNGGTIVGEGTDSPPYDLPTDGAVSVPGVGEGVIDGVGSNIDTESTIWDLVKAFIISLVIPSDAFWTDSFGALRGNFTSAFPMIDISNFESLIVGGKPFPNIYVNVFGSKCKIVDGDVINSIVDWLRPLVAGFMMLCLMLFNYRKIYKLVRNTEPFGNIAPGTSDFRTGMSAPSMSEGFSAYDIARDQLRDVAFDMRNEILSRKNKV